MLISLKNSASTQLFYTISDKCSKKGQTMKAILTILASVIFCSVSLSAYADPPVTCQAYGNANLLAYCTQALPDGRSRVSFPSQAAQNVVAGTNQLFHVLNRTHSVVPVYYSQPHPMTAVTSAASGILAATAWAYNWKHGYVGAQGMMAMSYMMNYPW
jgi:hypothetical protein